MIALPKKARTLQYLRMPGKGYFAHMATEDLPQPTSFVGVADAQGVLPFFYYMF